MTYKKFKNIKYFILIIFLAILSFLFVNSAKSNVGIVIINDCELKNLCKRIDVKYTIYLPKDLLRENYYLINGLLNPDRVFYITDIQKPNNSYYSGAVNLLYGSILHYVYFMKKTDFEKIPIKYSHGYEYPRSLDIFFIKSDDRTNCIAIDSEIIRNILIKHNLRSIKDGEPLTEKIFVGEVISNADYKNLLNILKKEGVSLLPCNEFLNKLIKIKFARPEDSDESVLRKLAQQLGVYDKYPLGYIPVISPISGLEIQYKADPEVKDGYITLTKIRETIYLKNETEKEFESSLTTTTPTTTSTNVITTTTSFQSIPARPTHSQSLLLNLWLKIKCFFLRLIGKAC
jgi:hypothetical protein